MKGSPGQLVRDLFKVLIHIEPYLAVGAGMGADKASIWTYGILCWTGKPSLVFASHAVGPCVDFRMVPATLVGTPAAL